MALKESIENVKELEYDRQNQKEESLSTESELSNSVKVNEKFGENGMENISSLKSNLVHETSNSSSKVQDISTIFQRASATLAHTFKGFASFRGFRSLDESQFSELMSLTRNVSREDFKLNQNISSKKSEINTNVQSEDSKTDQNVPKEDSKMNKNIQSVDAKINTDISSRDSITENMDEAKKTIGKKNRKRRKNWILKKRPCVPKRKISNNNIDTNSSLYEKLYQQCLDVINTDSGNHSSNRNSVTEEIASTVTTESEAKPLLDMALEVINKLKNDELNIKKEKNLLQQNQKKMLLRLINMLKENVPVNGDTDYENNLPFYQVPSGPSTFFSSRRKKAKNNFYGFRTLNPQTRDRGGLITAERLLTDSPPSSPTYDGSTKDNKVETACNMERSFPSLNSIGDLDFVFKPLSTPFPDVESISGSNSNLVTYNGFIRSGLVFRSQRTMAKRSTVVDEIPKVQTGLSVPMKNKNKKQKRRKIVRKIKNNKIKMSRMIKASQLDDKLGVKLQLIPVPRGKSLFTRGRDSLKLNVSNRFPTGKASDSNEAFSCTELRKMYATNTQFSFRGFSGPFGSPKKSDATSTFKGVSKVLPLSSAVRRKVTTRNVKRNRGPYFNMNEGNESDERLLDTASDIKLSDPISVVTSKVGRVNRVQPIAKVKSTSVRNPTNLSDSSLKKESLPIIVRQTLPSRSHVELHPDNPSSKLPVDCPEASTLYYPVHPFISHDLPVHFIPIDARKVPHFLPLYSPEIDCKNNSPIYPSFIRTRPSAEQKSPSEYVLSKGISTRSIPHRSFSEDKVRENLFHGISSAAKCPLIPEVRTSFLSEHGNLKATHVKSDPDSVGTSLSTSEADFSKPIALNKPTSFNSLRSLPNNSEKSFLPNGNSSINQNQKIHKCLQCDFVTPKLGVLKRHELTHSKGNSVKNEIFNVLESRFQNPAVRQTHNPSSEKVSLIRHPVKISNSVTAKTVGKNSFPKKVKTKTEFRQKATEQEQTFSGFTNHSVNSTRNSRLPTVSITPIYSKTE